MRSETMHRRSIKRSQALAALQQRRTGPPSSDAMLDVLNVQGHNTDGTQVQAHLAWLADGSDLYHVAVYGVRLDSDTVDLLFSELKLQ